MIICILLILLIVLTCGYGVYLVDRERIDGMRRAELKRATAAAMRYDRQMAKLKAHNMRAKRYRSWSMQSKGLCRMMRGQSDEKNE